MYEAFAFHPSRSYGDRQSERCLIEHAAFNADQTRALQNLGQQLSEPSLIAKYMALDPVAQDAFQERAAILEYEAGMSQDRAELEAFRMVMHTIADAL